MSTNAGAPALDLQQAGISYIAFKTKKKFASVALFIVDGQNTQLKVESRSTSQIAFHLPKALALESQLSIRLTYKHWYLGVKSRTIEIAFQKILQTYVPGREEKQKWSRSYGESCELVVELERTQERKHTSRRNSLSPITDQILEVCPHFRILVIGKTGAGKSSLINQTFGVNEADVSHTILGRANIETEIKSEFNPQFILHDSLGFQHGETDHLSIVENFIQRRGKESELRKKLHAIWICLQIPILGGRLLETGVESFLKMKADGKLGDVPVILVFTKYDVLVDSIKEDMYKRNPHSTTLEEDAKARAAAKILEECIQPLVMAMKRTVPHVTVSTSEESGYEQTLQDLIRVTFDTVFTYLEDASVATAMAQEVNPDLSSRQRNAVSLHGREMLADMGAVGSILDRKLVKRDNGHAAPVATDTHPITIGKARVPGSRNPSSEGEQNTTEKLQRWRDVRASYTSEDNEKRIAIPRKAASVPNDEERPKYEYREHSKQRRGIVDVASSSRLSSSPTLKTSRSLPSSLQEHSSSSPSRNTVTPYIKGSECLRRQRSQETIRWRREEIARRQELEMHQGDDEVWERQEPHDSKIVALVGRLTAIFDDVREYRKLLTCRHSQAQRLLDAFQMLLDTFWLDGRFRRNLVVATQRLSRSAGLYPACYDLANVELVDDHPFAAGGFADIYKGRILDHIVCLKVIRVYQTSRVQSFLKHFSAEAILWGQLSHPNLLPIFGLYRYNSRLCLVSPWMQNGDLEDYLKRQTDVNRIFLVSDVASGVDYLHTNNIVHGDLKGANILVDGSGRACLADFGLSSVSDPSILHWASHSSVGSKGGSARWQAPELFDVDNDNVVHNTKASDVYAFSCVCYEILTNNVPFFEVPRDFTVTFKVQHGVQPSRPPPCSPAWNVWGLTESFWSLMKTCWSPDPNQRPNIRQIVKRHISKAPFDDRPPESRHKLASAKFRDIVGYRSDLLSVEDLNSFLKERIISKP